MNPIKTNLIVTALLLLIFGACDNKKCNEYLPPDLSFESIEVSVHNEDEKSGFLVEMNVKNSNEGCTQIAENVYLVITPLYKASIENEWNGIGLYVANGEYGAEPIQNTEVLLYNPFDSSYGPEIDMAVIPLAQIPQGQSILEKDFFQPNVSGYFKIEYTLFFGDKVESPYNISVTTDSIYVDGEK